MKGSSDTSSLPRIKREHNGIRVFVGKQQYLLRLDKSTFEQAFADGVRCLQLKESSRPGQVGFSKQELDELRQQIVTEAIRFLVINQMPVRMTKDVFLRPRVIRLVFEKAESKFGGRSEDAYQLTSKVVDANPDEVRRVIANFDARAQL